MLQDTLSFSFEALELAEQLRKSCNETITGYWRIQIESDDSKIPPLLLAVVRGRIVFSGALLSWKALSSTLQRYIFQMRSPAAKQALEEMELELFMDGTLPVGKCMSRLMHMKLVSHDDVIKTLKLKVLSDFDTYLKFGGKADFIPDTSLLINAPIRGFELDGLLMESEKRREQWTQLLKQIPLPSRPLIIHTQLVDESTLTDKQKQQLKNLVVDDRSMSEIALHMSKDDLEVAKMLSPLFKLGLISAKGQESDDAKLDIQPEVFIVDDSPLLIQQFRSLVTKWGYRVSHSDNALTAVEEISKTNPSVIFLDINMPGASGFDLIKLIRRQPKIAAVPLVLLTAEKTLSNQWRAQWANCKFLSKPQTTQEIPSFRSDLYGLLQEIVPIEIEETLL